MKVAIVHDDLVQCGGAERVLEGICEIYPDAPVYTSVFDRDNESLERSFGSKDVRMSFLQKIPGWRFLYKALLPFYPIAFEQFNFDEYDLVISHTTRFAKCIITKPATKHVCYCHTPPRFLWHFSGVSHYGFGEILMNWLRILDEVTSARVDHFLAGSENARKRIAKIYRRDSMVVYPFIDLERFKNIKTSDGNYFVVIGRLNKYKRVDLAIKACCQLGIALKVIGTGSELQTLKRLPRELKFARNDIVFLEDIDDSEVVQILAGCKALVIPGIEDFGLTSLEAQALGKPVIAFKEGGALETVVENNTGLFFDKPTVKNLVNVMKRFNDLNLSRAKSRDHFNKKDCIENARRFSKQNFIRSFKQKVADL